MLNEQGFDLWADGYDRSVGLSDEGNTYPFAGYKRCLLYTSRGQPNGGRLSGGLGRRAAGAVRRAAGIGGLPQRQRRAGAARRFSSSAPG